MNPITIDINHVVRLCLEKGEIEKALDAVTLAPPSGGARRSSLKAILKNVKRLGDGKKKENFVERIAALFLSIGDMESLPDVIPLIKNETRKQMFSDALEEALKIRMAQAETGSGEEE